MKINILFFIIYIIIFLIYILYKSENSFEIKENFYTYFNPFTTDKIDKFNILYNSEYYKTNFFMNKYTHKYITFGQAVSDFYIKDYKNISFNVTFFNYLTKILLKESNILNIQNLNYKKINNLIIDTNRNLINFSLVSTPILAEVMLDEGITRKSVYKGNYLRFLFNTNKQYLLIITKKINNIYSINDISNNLRIGLDYSGSSDDKVTRQILDAFNKVENIDYIITYYNDNLNLLNLLSKDEADIVFLTISFPLPSLTSYFDSNFSKDFLLLSLDDLNFKRFFNQFYYYEKAYIDLNNLSANYLPVKINDRLYSKFNPYLLTISFFNIFITNKFVSNEIAYEVTNVFFNNINTFNKLDEFIDNKLIKNSCASLDNIQLLIHPGAEQYYVKKGYITYTDNKNCKYMVGKMPCTKETLISHNLFI